MASIKNTIIDFISGKQVAALPEEVDAVQVFARQLVEDYGYPKPHIQTHPQWRVKSRPSDAKREYPIDIAVFASEVKSDDCLHIIVECKQKNRRDGRTQLENYLTLSNARLGVWFNGEERVFIRKFASPEGEIRFAEIPNIPMFGQRVEDIGRFKCGDLKPTHNLKVVFRSIRSYLAANNVGATRDEALAQQLINIIFCKIYDEKYTAPADYVRFRAGADESAEDVRRRITDLFTEVKTNHPEVIDLNDEISLDTNSIRYVTGELQNYSLMRSERDAVADAFETFIGHALKGGLGQFFTPRNVVKLMVDILQPAETDKIIDPACGSGGFLIESLRAVWRQMDIKYAKLGWQETDIKAQKIAAATKNFRGLDKDYFLSKVAKAYMNIIGDGTTGIFCEDSLEHPQNWKDEARLKIQLGSFDIVLTNPPFGKSIPVAGEKKLRQYDLGYKWKSTHEGFEKTPRPKFSEAPEVLFIERCLQMLKAGGRLGIVLPDGIFNESETYLRKWLLQNVKILAIIDVCKETFLPNTSTKTSLLFLEKLNSRPVDDYEIFMGIAYFCGHNRRGLAIGRNDIPAILDNYNLWRRDGAFETSKNCFTARLSDLERTNFWTPKHFSPYYRQAADRVKNNYRIVKLGDIALLQKGSEAGSENYVPFIDRTETDIPFIRTGDLVNFAVNQTPDNFVCQEIYADLAQDLRSGDILYTKDGKIGLTAMLTKGDRVVISSGILRIRLKKEAQKDYGITPEYLFAVLSNKYTGYFQAIRSTIIAATIPHLREKRIADFDIPVMDADTIAQITANVSKSFDLKRQSAALDMEAIETLKNRLQIDEN